MVQGAPYASWRVSLPQALNCTDGAAAAASAASFASDCVTPSMICKAAGWFVVTALSEASSSPARSSMQQSWLNSSATDTFV